MANSYLTKIHTRKIITQNVVFIFCSCENMYSKKKKKKEKTCPYKKWSVLNIFDS